MFWDLLESISGHSQRPDFFRRKLLDNNYPPKPFFVGPEVKKTSLSRLATTSSSAALVKSDNNDGGGGGESIAMTRFDRRDDHHHDDEAGAISDSVDVLEDEMNETSLHRQWGYYACQRCKVILPNKTHIYTKAISVI